MLFNSAKCSALDMVPLSLRRFPGSCSHHRMATECITSSRIWSDGSRVWRHFGCGKYNAYVLHVNYQLIVILSTLIMRGSDKCSAKGACHRHMCGALRNPVIGPHRVLAS
jgi:hypothetical protein